MSCVRSCFGSCLAKVGEWVGWGVVQASSAAVGAGELVAIARDGF